MKGNLGYSIRERGDRFLVAFAHLAAQGSKSWPERTAPKELRTKSQVAKWAEGVVARNDALAPAKDVPKRPTGPAVRALYPAWLAMVSERPNREKATIADYRSAFDAVLLGLNIAEGREPPRLLGDEPAAALDVAACRRVMRALCKAPARFGRGRGAEAAEQVTPLAPGPPARTLSANRINNCASVLSVFLGDLVADRKVPFSTNPMRDPAVRQELPARPTARRIAVDDQRPGCATLDDAQAVIDAPTTSEELRVRVTLAFTGAERDGELAGLRVRAIHQHPVPHLRIVEAVKLLGPKGRSTPGELKTKSSVRVVPLHPAGLAALDEWLSIHWPRLTGRQPTPDDFVFVRPGTTDPHRPHTARDLRKALAAAGRPTERGGAPVTFHRARHTFASALAAAEVPLELRKLLLGHAAASVTESAYTEHGLQQLAEAVTRAIPITWTRQSARQTTRQLAESAPESAVNSGGEDGIRTRVGRFCKPATTRQERPTIAMSQPKKAATGHDGNGPTAGNGPRDTRQIDGCRVAAELIRRTAAAGLRVGISDAMWRTVGVDEDALIVGADLGEGAP